MPTRPEWRVPTPQSGVRHRRVSDPDEETFRSSASFLHFRGSLDQDYFVPASNLNVTVPASTLWTPKAEAEAKAEPVDNEIRLRVRVPAHLMAKYATMLAKRERPGTVKTKHMRRDSSAPVKRGLSAPDNMEDAPVTKKASASTLDWRLYRNAKIGHAEMEDKFLLRVLLIQAVFEMNDMQRAFEGLKGLQKEQQWGMLEPRNLIAATILLARAAVSMGEHALAVDQWTFALQIIEQHYVRDVDLRLLGYMGLARAHELQQQPEQMLENYTVAVELIEHSDDSAVRAHAHAGMARAAAMVGNNQMRDNSEGVSLNQWIWLREGAKEEAAPAAEEATLAAAEAALAPSRLRRLIQTFSTRHQPVSADNIDRAGQKAGLGRRQQR